MNEILITNDDGLPVYVSTDMVDAAQLAAYRAACRADEERSIARARRELGLSDDVIITPGHFTFGGNDMEKATVSKHVALTPTQAEQFAKATQAHGHTNSSAAIREAIAMYCAAAGIEFDTNVMMRGGWQGNEVSLRNLTSWRDEDGNES